ncbi:hypothetical protein G3A56_01805 [Rhizobium oryzihabitans]|uniref:Bacteriophage tail tape measure N-terminal domain-containing protein n=1 Tax=Rhizobium oryzihabitans TaxID=2267833 RepID=A0A7L5BDI8_9HYPH|nr:phage tail length tape measure family protein [Rhizobium oryzihabitans]QIB36886.1 hypothetical protein G3A56_01805 [Rhizobium oryzihabitans]
MDIAQLGIEVQSGGVKSATNDLKQFTNASRVAERAAAGLSDASGKFSTSEIAGMAAAMGTVEKTSNAAAKALAAASLAAQRAGSVGASGVKSLGQASGAARAQVQNLSYQMQDIVTMMAMGQSPFMLLAQQLPQVTQNGGQLNGVLSAIKQTITGLISPLGLATTAFVLIGSAAVSYFTEWMSKGSESNKIAEEQARLIEAVADEWGKAVPALQAYVAALKDAKSAADLINVTNTLADNQWDLARQQVHNLNVEMGNTISLMTQAGAESETIYSFQKAWEDVTRAVSEGRQDLDAMKRVQDALASAISQTGVPALSGFETAFNDLSQTIAGATRQAATFREAAVQALLVGQNGPKLGELSPLFSENGRFYSGEDFTPRDAPTPSGRPLIELEGLPSVGGGRTKTAKQSGYETATASIAEQTRALQAQTAAQSTLNPLVSDYGYAVAKAKVETDLLLAAEKDKKAITPELTAQISAQAESYAQAVVEQNRLTEATKKATEAVNFVKNTTAGFINDLRDGLKNGESFWESFSNAALNVLDRITDKLLNDVMDAIFKVSNAGSSSGGGGFLSSLFGGLFGGKSASSYAGLSGGLFADGGYTGNASAKAVAGVVHGGEYVFSKKATDRIGIGNLDAMHRSAKGYAVGGYVGSSATVTPANNNVQAGGQSVVMIQLSPELVGQILQQAQGQTVQIVKQNNKNKNNLYQNGQAQNG